MLLFDFAKGHIISALLLLFATATAMELHFSYAAAFHVARVPRAVARGLLRGHPVGPVASLVLFIRIAALAVCL